MPITSKYELTQVRGQGTVPILELASALYYTDDEWKKIFQIINAEGLPKFYCQFDLKGLGSGDVASNLRYKHDKTMNNQVVKNTLGLLNWYALNTGEPIVITSYPRSERYKTFKFLENGLVSVVNNAKKTEIVEDSEQMNLFLNRWFMSSSLVPSGLLDIRECCKGARYNSYLADLISFILMINNEYHPEMFDSVVKTPTMFNTTMKDERGRPLLRAFVTNGKEWVPKDFDYLYFEEEGPLKGGIEFSVPKSGSIGKVYHQLKEIICQTETGMKKLVREFLSDHSVYSRLSDYWVNDVDDGLTIMAIAGCYDHVVLTPDEERVKFNLHQIIENIF